MRRVAGVVRKACFNGWLVATALAPLACGDDGGPTAYAGTGGQVASGGTAGAGAGVAPSGGSAGAGAGEYAGDPDPATDTEFETVLRRSVRFYGAQRSGSTYNWLLMQYPSGQNSCFNADGHSIGLDLTGGWHDAGDHIKPTLTMGWSAMLMLKAYEAFPRVFDDLYGPTDPMGAGGNVRGTPNGVPDVLDEVKYAADYLARIRVGNSLVMQVGNTSYDHRGFVDCTVQDDRDVLQGGEYSNGALQGRPVSTGVNGHAGGLAVAALAMMGRLYQQFDPGAAAGYVAAAESVYAVASPTVANDGPTPYTGGKPDIGMVCGAAELYRATGTRRYLDEAVSLAGPLGAHYYVAGYDNPHEYCFQSLYLAQLQAGESTTGLGKWISNVQTPMMDGLVYSTTWQEWGVLRFSTTAVFSAVLADLAQGFSNARDPAVSTLQWIMGSNAYGRSFICGYGTNPPVNPHHRNTHAVTPPFVLYGGLVGGPVPGATYVDDSSDFVTNEVAIDYNAGLVGLAAYGVHLERSL